VQYSYFEGDETLEGPGFDLRHQQGGEVFELTNVSFDIVLYIASVVDGRDTL